MSSVSDLIREHVVSAGMEPRQIYTLKVWDDDKSLLRLLEFLQKSSLEGHSVTLEERGDQMNFGFDGDGADKIIDIKVEESVAAQEIVAASRIAAGVRKDEVPEKYRKLKYLGAGATTVAYQKNDDTVYIFTRDAMKIEWLQHRDEVKILDEFTSYKNPIPGISELPIYIAEVPMRFKLSKENAKLIRKALKEFQDVFYKASGGSLNLSKKARKEHMYREVLTHFSKDENHILADLWSWLSNYDAAQFNFDLSLRNFMQDADGKIVISDPIVCSALLDLMHDYKSKARH